MESQEKKREKKGCLRQLCVVCFVFFLIVIWAFWMMGDQGRRAKKAHQTIRIGMTFNQVEGLLKGRHWINYYLDRNGKYELVKKDEFHNTFSSQSDSTITSAKLDIIFRGMSPAAFSFDVLFDLDGKVSEVTEVNFWD